MAHFYKLERCQVMRRGRTMFYPIGTVEPIFHNRNRAWAAHAFPVFGTQHIFKTKYAALKFVISSYCTWVGIGVREYF